MGDFLLCQITSKQYDDAHALSLKESDFLSGGLQRVSFIRVGKLFTANEAIIVGLAGHIEPAKIAEAIALLVKILSAGLQDDIFWHADIEDGAEAGFYAEISARL
jgi:mRNA interferase MazF